MKTFKTIVKTFIFTVVFMAGVIFVYLFKGGNISITKESTDHSRIVIEDDKVTENTRWTELKGYNLNINILDGTYIGK